MKNKSLLILTLFITFTSYAQKFAGIEIGGKGIKVAVVDILNVEEGRFNLIKDWTVNTAVTKGISANKQLAKEDISATANAVNEIYKRLQTDFNIPIEKIFIAGSSGVAIATNTDELKNYVFTLTNKEMFFINSEQEGKLVTKGAVPAKRYNNSFVWDIGGGNSKGGYVLKDEGGYYNFFPMAFDLGCVTLTSKIQKVYHTTDFNSFKFGLMQYVSDTLKYQIIKPMFDNKSAARRKQNFYAVGGASFAFATLMFPEKMVSSNLENYIPFKYSDVETYYRHLTTDFDAWSEIQRQKNPDAVEKVFELYSKEALLVGSTIMFHTMDEMNNKQQVNGYFVRKGQVAWIIAYVVDYVRKNN